ncbi:MAG: type IX secretion system membrane protein PorP/SprF [Chitinophagales bacterium]
MKKIYLHFVLLVAVAVAALQGRAQDWRHYMLNNQSVYNPAFTGASEQVVGSLNYNMQAAGFPGTPKTAMAQFNGRLGFSNAALGGGVSYANYGILSNYGTFLNFAYGIPFRNHHRIQLGFGGSFNFLQEKGSSLSTTLIGDDVYKVNANAMQFNFTVGAAYVGKNFWVGFAVPKLIRNSYDYSLSKNKVRLAAFNFNLMAGYDLRFGNFHFLPSFLLRSDEQTRFNCEINTLFKYKEAVWFGPYYRVNAAYGLILGVGITKYLQLSYAGEIQQTKLRTASYGSHEITLGFRLPKSHGKIAQGPRYF